MAELTVSEKGDQSLHETSLCISTPLASCRDAVIHWAFSTGGLAEVSVCLTQHCSREFKIRHKKEMKSDV